MDSTFRKITLAIAAITLLSISAVAQPSGAQTTAGTVNESQSTTGAGQAHIAAGNVSEIDISDKQNTDKWAGFYGQITASKVLGTPSNLMFQWTAQTFGDSWVFAVPSSAPAPTSLSTVSDPNSLMNSYDDDGGFDNGVANASRTFNLSKNPSTEPLGAPNSQTAAVETFGSSGDQRAEYTTLLYDNGDASNSPVYVANGSAANAGFTGDDVNYQMLIGVGENDAATTFDFYLQIP